MQKVTTRERHLHIASADGAPGFKDLVDGISDKFGVNATVAQPVVMDDYNPDWDTLYPFSAVCHSNRSSITILTMFDAIVPGAV